MGLKEVAGRLLKNWATPNALAEQLYALFTSTDVEDEEVRSKNLMPTVIERTVLTDQAIASATPADIFADPINLVLKKNSSVLVWQTADWSISAAGVFESYVTVDQTSFQSIAAIASNVTAGAPYLTASRVAVINLLGGTYAVRWKAVRSSGGSTGTLKATVSRLLLIPVKIHPDQDMATKL